MHDGRDDNIPRLGWWPELLNLLEDLERRAARREHRPRRPLDTLCAWLDRRAGLVGKKSGLATALRRSVRGPS